MSTKRLFDHGASYLLCGLVMLCTAISYISIASTRLTNANYGSDGGDFLAAVLTQGIPHPTGYPTYVLLGSLFQFLPVSTPVFRAVLESLLPAAISAGLLAGWIVYIMGSKETSTLLAAFIAGTAWGIAPLLFSQAVIIEVHGLQSLFVVIVLWWVTLNLTHLSKKNTGWVLCLSVVVGLGLGNHLILVLFAPVAVLALYYMVHQSKSWKLLVAELGLAIMGTFVYIYLPIRAHAYPAVNWGNPQTLAGFFWEISANPYQGLVFSASKIAILERLRSIASLLLDQFGALGLVAGVIGVTLYSFKIKWLRWILVWIFLAYLAFAIGYNAEDSVGYLLPAIMMFAVWIGLAIPSIYSLSWKKIPIGFVIIAVLAISIWIKAPATRARIDPRFQDQPARYAEQLLQEAPANAIVYTSTDQDSFPLWYYHFGLHERPDIRVIVLPLTQFVWYQQTIVSVYPDLIYPTLYTQDLPNADWGREITRLNPGHPVCNTRLTPDSSTGISFQCSSQ